MEDTMDTKKRCEIVRAMELLARAVNNEDIFYSWLMVGVADGDIGPNTTDEDLSCYIEDDEEFADLMDTFLRLMRNAHEDGGLYVDGIVSEPSPIWD